ncbi:hypothetical protein FKP32DRAFT_34511 [Trametes sanguinea]|nr:hypothetical protein FKP32DRAFT_34511 [Trametes sanguinea]
MRPEFAAPGAAQRRVHSRSPFAAGTTLVGLVCDSAWFRVLFQSTSSAGTASVAGLISSSSRDVLHVKCDMQVAYHNISDLPCSHLHTNYSLGSPARFTRAALLLPISGGAIHRSHATLMKQRRATYA